MFGRVLPRSLCVSCRQSSRPFVRASNPCQSPLQPVFSRPAPRISARSFAKHRYTQHEYESSFLDRFGRVAQIRYYWRNSQGFRFIVKSIALGGGIFVFTHIEKIPVTGRRRFNFISPEAMAAMANEQYQVVMKQYHGQMLSDRSPETRLARRVLDRLIPSSGLSGPWELHVVRSEEANAFVLPG